MSFQGKYLNWEGKNKGRNSKGLKDERIYFNISALNFRFKKLISR